jgi:CheY-like chemotaxis protein
MDKQRIYVHVVGFSDVERHALNTVFRLSEERELAYAPWVPLSAPGTQANSALAEVILVDGASAEAVLLHAKTTPPGQRLIWVGSHAPDHAWRVLSRPIHWASVLNDLDAVFAARQADSGFLDLDVTMPGPLELEAGTLQKRALIVGATPAERTRMLALLAEAGVTETDRADSTETALEAMTRNRYICGIFDLDEHHVDTWQLARHFAQHNPNALTMGVSQHAGPLAPWLNRRRVKRDTQLTGINALVARPLQETELRRWIELLN